MLELDLGKRDDEEEWEVQSVVGGTPEKGVRGVVVRKDVKVREEGESGSESEAEMGRLVYCRGVYWGSGGV